MSDVTPTNDAAKVKIFFLSNTQNDIMIKLTDKIQSIISHFEKSLTSFFIFHINSLQKNKHPYAHLLKPNDVYTNALHSATR